MPLISACICTYNRYDMLPAAIDSLMAQDLSSDTYQIIVVDNSPDTESAERFGADYAAIENLSYVIERKPGLSNARNVGTQLCQTPFIAFIDDDAIAAPNWLSQLFSAFEAFGDQAAIVGGRVDPIWEEPRPPWIPDSMLGHLSVVNWGLETRPITEKEWLAGTNIAFRTDLLQRFGGFSEHLGRIGPGNTLLSNEEIAVMRRLHGAGYSSIYAAEARVSHLVDKRRLTRSWMRKRAAWQALSDHVLSMSVMDRAALAPAWEDTLDYFSRLPPRYRTVAGLSFPTDDPELFARQVGACYTIVAALLAGLDGLDET